LARDNRQPCFWPVLSDVVIGSKDLLIGRIQRKNFDRWVFGSEPSYDLSSGFFGSRVADDKKVVILNRA